MKIVYPNSNKKLPRVLLKLLIDLSYRNAIIVVAMITNPEINRRYGRAFSRNALILVLETPIYKIVNTAIIGINTPIENKPKVDITPVLKEPIWLAENIKLRRIPAIHGAFRNVNVAPNKNEVIPESLTPSPKGGHTMRFYKHQHKYYCI